MSTESTTSRIIIYDPIYVQFEMFPNRHRKSDFSRNVPHSDSVALTPDP